MPIRRKKGKRLFAKSSALRAKLAAHVELKPTLQEEDFASPFDAKPFIESLTRRLVYQTRGNEEEEFDPAPFLRVMDNTTEELLTLGMQVDKKVEKLVEETKKAKDMQSKAAEELDGQLEEIWKHFEQLSGRIDTVASTVHKRGDELEGVDVARRRAEEAHDLLMYFMEFNRGNLDKLSPVFQAEERLTEAAAVTQKLSSVVDEIERTSGSKSRSAKERQAAVEEKTKVARRQIAKYSEHMEQRLRKQFEEAYRLNNIPRMQSCASTLYNLSKGQGCAQTYVSLNALFFKEDQLVQDVDIVERGHADRGRKSLPGLEKLYQDIVEACTTEYHVMQQIFPNPLEVMELFLYRLFEQRIVNFVEMLLRHAVDQVDWLRTIHASYSLTLELVDKLVEADIGVTRSSIEHHCENVFLSHREKYLSREKAALTSIYEKETKAFEEMQTPSTSTDRRRVLHWKKKGGAGSQQSDDAERLMRTIEVSLNMIYANEEAIQRCKVLAQPSEKSAHVGTIFGVLVRYLMLHYVHNFVDVALKHLPPAEPKSPPDTPFFEVVQVTNQIVHLLQRHYQKLVVPELEADDVMETGRDQKEAVSSLESKVLQGLERTLESILAYAQRIIKETQKKNDFKPKDDIVLDQRCTPAMRAFVDFVESKRQEVVKSIDGQNVDAFLYHLGNRLYHILLKHYKRFTINSIGAFRVKFDSKEIRDEIGKFGLPKLNTMFESIGDIASLLLVNPENLKDTAEEATRRKASTQFGLEPEDVAKFIHCRADFKSAKLQGIVKELLKETE